MSQSVSLSTRRARPRSARVGAANPTTSPAGCGPGPHAAGLVVGFAAPTRADLGRALPVLTGALRDVLA